MSSPTTPLDILQSVRFVSSGGRRFAVLDADEWEALIELLETIEDSRIVRDADRQLGEFGGDRERAGWRRWESVENELS